MNPTLFRASFRGLKSLLNEPSESLLTGKRPTVSEGRIYFTLISGVSKLVHCMFVNGYACLDQVDFKRKTLDLYLKNVREVDPGKYPFPIILPADVDWTIETDLTGEADPAEIKKAIKEALSSYLEVFHKVDQFYERRGIVG
jgi:hypothetical protein